MISGLRLLFSHIFPHYKICHSDFVSAYHYILICLQFALQSTNLKSYFKESQTVISDTTQNSIGLSEKSSESYYSEHGVYVAGIGFIEKSKSYDYFKENDYENKL